jgi:hypothetical protein
VTGAVPGAWPFLLLAAAAYRSFRILCCDTIFDRPRASVCGRMGDKFTEWITCPFCAGAYVSVGWWLAWVAWPHWTLVVAVPFALSAALALTEINLGPADD